MQTYLGKLKTETHYEKIRPYVDHVLNDPRFAYWSGSGAPEHHHFGTGGLVQHTWEVFEFCNTIAKSRNFDKPNEINIPELLIAAVWHDYGKIWDYQDVDNLWGKHDNHARQIHHISRSAIEFAVRFDRCGNPLGLNKDHILHCILAHHGKREYGSPVAPATKEAWILHLSDNLSARLDDCEKHDILNHR